MSALTTNTAWVWESVTALRHNAQNPRIIKDARFRMLVASIQEFPQMLELRPIVVNEDRVVLGGNQRLKAAQVAGLTQVPVIIAKGLSAEQEREFVIKDNVSAGSFAFSVFFEGGDWDFHELSDWGVEFPFSPSYDPSTQHKNVTDADVSAANNKLSGQYKDQKDLREITCPHCAQEFHIDA